MKAIPRTRRRRWRRSIAGLVAAGLVLGLAASWTVGSLLVRPARSNVPPPPPPGRDVQLRAADGLRLAGSYWPGRRRGGPAVLLLHGNDASRAATADNAAWLAGRGYAVLTIDFRGHGESAAAPHSFGLRESRDTRAALAWLKRADGGGPVAAVGISLGGAASLIGDDGPLAADALVLQAVYPDIRHAIRNRIAAFLGAAPARLIEPLLSFQSRPRLGVWPGRLSPLEAVKRYPGPVLVIGGGADAYTPPAETRAMFAAAAGPKRLWFAEGADHRTTSDLETGDYRLALSSFLAATIGSP